MTASAFGDIRIEVVPRPLFQTPEEAADLAVLSGVHVVGSSSLAGGVIPCQDCAFLNEHGIAAVLRP